MAKVKITCDSTCDLSPEMYAEYGISMIPLGISLGEENFRDSVDVGAAEIFAYEKKTGDLPKTFAVSPDEYLDFFREKLEGYDAVVHINLSSEISSCCQNASFAAGKLHNVFTIDSKNLSGGSGLLAIEAAKLARAGADADEIVRKISDMRDLVDVSFILSRLDYLHKGGRCSDIAAFGANILKIHPTVEVTDGKMQVALKFRGQTEKTLSDYVLSKLSGNDNVDDDLIFVAHSLLPRNTVDNMLSLVRSLRPEARIVEMVAGSTICSHCGPDCFGLFFLKKH